MHASDPNKEWLRAFLEVKKKNIFTYTFAFFYIESWKNVFALLCKAYASRGYVAIGLDSRYHGERADSKTAYRDVKSLFMIQSSIDLSVDFWVLTWWFWCKFQLQALISSWQNGNTMPFIFDTVNTLLPLSSIFFSFTFELLVHLQILITNIHKFMVLIVKIIVKIPKC